MVCGGKVIENPDQVGGDLKKVVEKIWKSGYRCYGCHKHREIPREAELHIAEHGTSIFKEFQGDVSGLKGEKKGLLQLSNKRWWLSGKCKYCNYGTSFVYMDSFKEIEDRIDHNEDVPSN